MSVQGRKSDWFHRPSVLAEVFDPWTLRGHFVFGQNGIIDLPAWETHQLGSWVLRSETSLPVVTLRDPESTELGWLIGQPVDIQSATLLRDSAVVPVRCDDSRFEERFEAWLYAHGGRFAAILLDPVERVYVDAFGTLPVLFEPTTKTVASSPFLLAGDGGKVEDSPLVDLFDIHETGAFFPFGTTCLARARHLLPSHVLDLSSFEERRIWPSGQVATIDLDEAVEKVGAIVEATVAAFVSAGDVCMGITAGGDSRLLLACSRDVADELRLFTVRLPDHVARNDVKTAGSMTRMLGLRHSVLPWVEPTSDDVRRWFYRTGAMCGEERGSRVGPSNDPLAPGGVNLLGVGIEVARARPWRRGDSIETHLDAVGLLDRMRIARSPITVELCNRWLSGLPPLSTPDIVDLCYLEVVFGCWGGTLTHGCPDAFTAMVYPFSHREIVEAIFGLPYADRKADRLRREVVARRWPELAALPLNDIPIRHKALARAHWLSRTPSAAVRRVRRKVRMTLERAV